MRSRSRFGVITLAALLAVACAEPAQASFFSKLTYGLSYLAGPVAPSGSRNGQFNISYEPLQRGWRFDWARSFGPDALGRPNAIDFGVADLTLNSGRVVLSAQQYTRGISGVEVTSATSTPISYTFSLNTGAQDVVANGTIGFQQALGINEYGFYDLIFSASNRGTSQTEGLAVADTATLDFDIGPINISGNAFADILSILTEPLFAGAGVQNPFAKFSGVATKEALIDAPVETIRAKIEEGETLTDDEVGALVNATVLASILGITTPDLEFLQDAHILELAVEETAAPMSEDAATAVPEPSTVLLVGIPLVLLALSRPRRRPR